MSSSGLPTSRSSPPPSLILRDNTTAGFRKINRSISLQSGADGYIASGSRNVIGLRTEWPVIVNASAAGYVSRGHMLRLKPADIHHNRAPYEPATPVRMTPAGQASLATKLGAALRDVVAFLPLAAAPPGSPAPAVVPIAGCGIPELRWSPDGEHLLALCTTGATSPKLIRIALSDRTTSSQNADGVLRTLGWRADGELVVVRRRGSGEEPAILLPSGKSRALYKRQENQFALFYFSGPDQTLFAQGGEDSGDATALRLAGPAPNASRAWLKSFPRLKDLGFSSDGRWVLFVQPLGGDRAGGEVYLVGTGMENPRKVLSATSARSFSQPMSRPVPPR